nr:MAG TPA: tail tube protein [Caudoviricetes sp.]
MMGVRYPRYCPYTITQNPDGTETETLGVGKVMGKATVVNTTYNSEAAEIAGDDGIAESVSPITGGTIENGLTDLLPSAKAEILGHELTETGGVIARADDIAPYMRVGYIGMHVIDGENKYAVWINYRVKYSEPSPQYTTKGRTITLSGTTINGTIMRNADGIVYQEEIFDTVPAALTFLNEKLNITAGSIPEFTATFSPADGASDVPVGTSITITANNPVDHGGKEIVLYNNQINTVVPVTRSIDATKKIITITPKQALENATNYILSAGGLTDAYGQQLTGAAVIEFTTVAGG